MAVGLFTESYPVLVNWLSSLPGPWTERTDISGTLTPAAFISLTIVV